MKIKLFLLSILGVFALTSCEDFLDEQPVSSLSKDNFYQDEPGMVTFSLAGAYALTRTAYLNEYLVSEQRTANSGLANPEGEWEQLNSNDVRSSNTLVNDYWDAQYAVLNSANFVIENIELLPEAMGKEQVKAEALYLRALMHFNLARNFNEFYYMNSTLTWEEAIDAPLTTASACYSSIIADLVAAIPSLPSSPKAGKASAGAAATLLADVYLTAGDKANAMSVLSDVIADSVYTLLPNFADNFNPDNEVHSESVYQICYIAEEESTGQDFSIEFSYDGFIGGANLPTDDLLSIWGVDVSNYLEYAGNDTRVLATAAELEGEIMNAKYGDDSEDWSGRDYYVYRYADVLLMYVESTLDGGSTSDADAIDRFNQVLSRATGTTVAGPITQDELLLQRRAEFAGENKYLYDLRRLGTGAPEKLEVPDRESSVRSGN